MAWLSYKVAKLLVIQVLAVSMVCCLTSCQSARMTASCQPLFAVKQVMPDDTHFKDNFRPIPQTTDLSPQLPGIAASVKKKTNILLHKSVRFDKAPRRPVYAFHPAMRLPEKVVFTKTHSRGVSQFALICLALAIFGAIIIGGLSLDLGLLAAFLLLEVAASIFGYIAIEEIENYPDKYKGKAIAIIGIVISSLTIVVMLWMMLLLVLFGGLDP